MGPRVPAMRAGAAYSAVVAVLGVAALLVAALGSGTDELRTTQGVASRAAAPGDAGPTDAEASTEGDALAPGGADPVPAATEDDPGGAGDGGGAEPGAAPIRDRRPSADTGAPGAGDTAPDAGGDTVVGLPGGGTGPGAGDGNGDGDGLGDGNGDGGEATVPRLADREGLWVVPAAGGPPTYLGPTFYSVVEWSPDGRTLVTKRTLDSVELVAADGSWARRLPCEFGCDDPLWSPTGDAIAYRDWHGRSVVVDLDGQLVSVLDPHGDGYGGIAWSPDGRWLALASADNDTGATALHLMEVATGVQRVLETGGRYPGLRWSPSGRYLGWTGGDSAIVHVRAIGTGTPSTAVAVRMPSGPAYAFAWNDADDLLVSGVDLWLFDDALGQGSARLLSTSGYAIESSADGRGISWVERPGAGFGTGGIPLVIADAAGGHQRVLTWMDGAWSLEAPNFSPSGDLVAFFAIGLCNCTWPF